MIYKDPYTLTYEVLQLHKLQQANTVFTSSSYEEAVTAFEKYFETDRRVRMDLVVRKSDGEPIFRSTIMELNEICTNEDTRCYSDDYGWFGPCVYNSDYKNSQWAGYECYSRPIKTF